ncbi:MAG TPA: HAMP domain-containing sensor histidine kinase, partial [Treponemataceae bacterium]|nr:HAMP domain-containing sensor histidine kinase [Treponemataceae bacterium]
PGAPQGQMMTRERLMTLMQSTANRYLYQFDSPSRRDGAGFFIVTRILRSEHKRNEPMTRLLLTIFVVFILLLSVFAFFTAIAAHRISASILGLEKATKRIAEGELDLVLDTRGNDEINSLTLSLNRMRLALKDDRNRRARFIMGVSHDLKTPLALIKGYAEAISDGVADDPKAVRHSLEIIGSKVDQLVGMIDDLIGFVKLDTGEWRKTLEDKRLGPILKTWDRRITEDARVLGRNFESSINIEDRVTVRLDEKLLVRALDNIAANALRYAPEGGLIRFSASLEGDTALLRVADDGPGIAKEDLPHIFELFYRGTNSRREEGMGLGLSVVKSVADSHGWDIGVESAPGKGSVFTIAIPLG